MLENVEEQARSGEELALESFDYDVVGSNDSLGKANPISLVSMCADESAHTHKMDLFKDYKKTGSIVFQSRFVWQEPDPPPNPKLNNFCMLEVVIVKADFLKDADMIGKQDPYIRFKYNGKVVRTDVKDEAGKHAEWNEKFCLTKIQQ